MSAIVNGVISRMSGEECSICLEEMKDTRSLPYFWLTDSDYQHSATRKCGHVFHANCYLRVKNNSENKKLCPLCRDSSQGITLSRRHLIEGPKVLRQIRNLSLGLVASAALFRISTIDQLDNATAIATFASAYITASVSCAFFGAYIGAYLDAG